MKTLHIAIITIICVAGISFSAMNNSYATGGYPCFFTMAPFQKQVYEPGETITIRAVHCHPESTDTAKLIIADGMADLSLGSATLEDYKNGKNIIYQESKQAGPYGIAEFNFTIPKSSNTFRYIVLLSPGGMGGCDMSSFFTKKDANKVQISDVNFVNPEVKQGDLLKFKMKVTDSLGNPLPFFEANAVSSYTGCGSYNLENGFASSQMSDSDRNQYYSTGTVWGWFQIPQGNPGTYTLNLTADTGYVSGFEPAKIGGLQFKVLGNTTIQNEMDVFAHYGSSDTEPSGYGDLAITPDPKTKHLLDYRAGDQLDLTGQTKHTTCVSYTDQMPVRVEVKRMHMDVMKANQFGSDAIRYGSNLSCYTTPQLCTTELVKTIDLTEGPGTFFGLGGPILDFIKEKPGEYLVNFTATYHNANFQNAIGLRVHNVKDYQVGAEGKNYTVSVDTWYSDSGNLAFDKENKKLTLDVASSNGPKVVDIFFPPDLLDGQLAVLSNGQKVIDEKSDLATNLVQKTASNSHVTVFPTTNDTHIEIIGTTAVPESLTPSVLMVTGIISVISVTQLMRRPEMRGRS